MDISIGNFHGGAVDKEGNAFTWGYVDHGKLGHSLEILNPEMDLRSISLRSDMDSIIKVPTKVENIQNVKKIITKYKNTFLIDK